MTLDSVLTGIVTGVVASIIIIVMQTIFDYIKRKKYEMFHFYEFDSFDIDECAPPEYLRESGNAGHTKVKMELPFDMKCVQVFLRIWRWMLTQMQRWKIIVIRRLLHHSRQQHRKKHKKVMNM